MMGSCFRASSSGCGKRWTRLPFTGHLLFAPEHLLKMPPAPNPATHRADLPTEAVEALVQGLPPKPHTSKTLGFPSCDSQTHWGIGGLANEPSHHTTTVEGEFTVSTAGAQPVYL